jgi:ABC-type transport system involved in cytochrome c biogenesis permease subunit
MAWGMAMPVGPVVVGAALAGLASLAGVVLGVHWVGAPVGVLVFAASCGRPGRDRGALRADATLTPRSSDA